MKRSLLSLAILSLALLLLGSPALATTPIAVDIYQDMESGNTGDVLTASHHECVQPRPHRTGAP